MTPALPRAPRAHCPTCLRPQSACLCAWVVPVRHPVEVLILQHPLEVNHAKGTARLLHLSLPHSRLVTGEGWEPQVLRQLLTGPWDAPDTPAPSQPRATAGAPGTPVGPATPIAPKRVVLLYPDTPHDVALGLPPPPALAPETLHDPARLRLVVLDGTWRKSRKMLYLNPLLQQLPRLPLQGLPASRYRIRKAHQPHQLSTLEATCAALAQLEDGVDRFESLLAAFDGLVAQWQQARLPTGRPWPPHTPSGVSAHGSTVERPCLPRPCPLPPSPLSPAPPRPPNAP